MEYSQLLKGVLEGCVLSIISQQETYGYEILSVLSSYGFRGIQDGTLYPILTRMEKKKYIQSRIDSSSLGPKRRYFSITSLGEKELNEFKITYALLSEKTKHLLEGGNYGTKSTQ